MSRKYALFIGSMLCAMSMLFAQENQGASANDAGAKIYKKKCAVCHGKKGTGKGKRIPPLAKSDYLLNNISESIKAIKFGLEGEITVNGIVYDKVMQPIKLSDQEVADVMNFILNSWGNKSEKSINAEKVASGTRN